MQNRAIWASGQPRPGKRLRITNNPSTPLPPLEPLFANTRPPLRAPRLALAPFPTFLTPLMGSVALKVRLGMGSV